MVDLPAEGDGADPDDVVLYEVARGLAISDTNQLCLLWWSVASTRGSEVASNESLPARTAAQRDEDDEKNSKSDNDQDCSERGEIPLPQLADSL